MRSIALLVSAVTLIAAPTPRDGNFEIRFEPSAKLQTKVQVPFEIVVRDGRKQPLLDAKVSLQIEMQDHSHMSQFKGPALDPVVRPGVYLAKPIFPVAGQWNVVVQVQRDDAASERTIQFNVVE